MLETTRLENPEEAPAASPARAEGKALKEEGPPDTCPFQKAETLEKRLKGFFYGPFGSGKTNLALHFPNPVVIDLERGSDLYGDSYDFEVLHASTADEVMAAVDWLRTHRHGYRTLVVDPITVYWEALQRRWSEIFLRRNRGSKGFKGEFYDFQPRDWMPVKAELKEFLRKLIALDMNVVVTAREKPLYAEGTLMKAVGETFDAERSLPYLFDTIVRLYRDEQGRFMGTCLKDRSNRLPKVPFENSYALFESLFGREALSREAKPITPATADQKRRIRELLARSPMTPGQVTKRLAAYGAACLDDLSEENAQLILAKIASALSAQSVAPSETPISGKE